jgi:hypothetical protein
MMLVMNHGGRGQYRMGIYKKEIISIHGEHTNKVFFFFFNFVLMKNWLNFFFSKISKISQILHLKNIQKNSHIFVGKRTKKFGEFFYKKIKIKIIINYLNFRKKLHTRQANILPLEPMNEAKEKHVMCPLPYSNLSTKLSTLYTQIDWSLG